MNKQEAMKRVEQMGEYERFVDEPISKKTVLNIISQIHEPQKVVVSQVAVEYYYKFKDYGYSLVELLGDFCYQSTREKFPRLNELETWLYGNDEATNRQRELALATLIVNGPDAVEIEQEQLYTVEIPDPRSGWKYRYLTKNSRGISIIASDNDKWKTDDRNRLTESEIKQDFEQAWNAGFAKEVGDD
ncbi:DUF1642 domain-containing protein [Streptococcus suis]